MKQIEQFNDQAGYNAAGKPTDASRVSQIKDGNLVKFDGVNVETTSPEIGDAVYSDGSKVRFYKGETLNHALLIAEGLVGIGEVDWVKNGKALVRDKNYANQKYADVIQFKVTIPTENGTLTMGAQFVTSGTPTSISVEYEVGMTLATEKNTYEVNDTTLCGRINTALAALDGINGDWWAYLDNDGDVILQRDTWTDYRQYTCSGALTFVTWGDMPATTGSVLRVNGINGDQRIMSVERGAIYYATNGRTPAANVPLNEAATIVTLEAFNTSAYCALLRETYKTYENYINSEYTILWPQNFGMLRLPSGKELTMKYALASAPTKAGGTKYKFPFFYYCYNRTYNVAGLSLGDWFAPGVVEGIHMMNDSNRAIINSTATKMGNQSIPNSTSRWFAQRYNVNTAWFFHGSYGYLSNNSVINAFRAQAVALLDIE